VSLARPSHLPQHRESGPYGRSDRAAAAARRYADLVIRPRAGGIGLLEFDQLDTAREVGRAVAREALDRAPASIVA
jgi:predicted acylesterase/phospholipase RssA